MKPVITYSQMFEKLAASGTLKAKILKALKEKGKLPK